ncbi:hypothetical protein KY342_04295 [Candidatus Woesearchaeota archaeon]|nr:hypothetical protein [Candidatus Woesearchaeota archaeon]
MNKKGQITIFIIIGIILLLSVALFIFLRQEITIFRPREVVPPELVPVVNFMDNCLNELGTEAAHIIGATGGYIDFPDGIKQNPLSSLSLAPFDIERGRVPYWYYEGQRRIPTIDFMEDQMNHYIEDRYRDCINDLAEFRQQFNITELGPIIVRTKLEDENTPVVLNFPLEFSDILGKRIAKIETRTVTLPFRIRRAYTLAKAVMEAEETDMKLEDITMDLIAIDPDVPYSDMEFSCAKKRWSIEDVRNKIKALLRTNLDEIRIGNTNYIEVPEDKPYIFNHYIWYVTDLSYNDLGVSFSYSENWPFYLYIRPNKGAYLESGMQKGLDIVSWLCMQTWKFTYDIRYPVLATVTDKDSGYNFNFAFRVLIDHNQGNRVSFPVTEFEFETNPTEEEYCERRVNDITVYTFDNVSVNGVEDYIEINDVELSYTCLKHTCLLGKTEWTDGGAVAELTTAFPYCVWGILRGKKEGYKDAQLFMSTDSPGEVQLYLTPVKEIKNYKVVKHPDVNPLIEQELSEGESATIAINRAGHSTYGAYPVNADVALEFLAEEDFNYTLEVFLTDQQGIKGGYSAEWEPSWAELRDAENIKFHVIYTMDATEDERLSFVTELEDNSKLIPGPEIR